MLQGYFHRQPSMPFVRLPTLLSKESPGRARLEKHDCLTREGALLELLGHRGELGKGGLD